MNYVCHFIIIGLMFMLSVMCILVISVSIDRIIAVVIVILSFVNIVVY